MISSYKFFNYTLIRWISNYDEESKYLHETYWVLKEKDNVKLDPSFYEKIIKIEII